MPGRDGLAIGRRQDNSGDGYHFRGVVDEVRLYDRALLLDELRAHWNRPETIPATPKPVGEWTFKADGSALMKKPRDWWKSATMEIKLGQMQQQLQIVDSDAGHQVALTFDPVASKPVIAATAVTVTASELVTNKPRPVSYDATLGWHRVNIDGIDPIAAPGGTNPSNDAIERVKLVLSNPTDQAQITRLMFEKTQQGFHQRIGTPITGVSAILRDADGNPTGIPVQLSKNWHHNLELDEHARQWLHGITQLRLPAKATIELELTLAYGHWGGVAAASHAQLSLIGWGSNQLWDQSALGAWGESICYEPDQVQGECSITDVRPAMVKSPTDGKPWSWTGNIGAGDFFRYFNAAGERVPHSAMRTTYHKQGPCLTEVTYAGRIGTTMTQSATVSLARTDDLVRGVYRLRLDVNAPTDFTRFVVFQIGADTYCTTAERKMALGNESGLIKEWNTQWGGNVYRTSPMECLGRIPWMSLHEAVIDPARNVNSIANRGIVIRSWKAKLGGKEASPWLAERGQSRHLKDSSTLDLVIPPELKQLQSGDYIEATIEHVLVPQFAADYYGPSEALRTALTKDANSWRMIQREAIGGDRRVQMKVGKLVRMHPAITIHAADDQAEFTLAGGLGYVPITFTGLSSPRGHRLLIDGKPLNQSIHGNDFWQADYDPIAQRWSLTYNVRNADGQSHSLKLAN
jgi:hypothetical protein